MVIACCTQSTKSPYLSSSNKNTDKKASARLEHLILHGLGDWPGLSLGSFPSNDGDDDMDRSTSQHKSSALFLDRESQSRSSQSKLPSSSNIRQWMDDQRQCLGQRQLTVSRTECLG